MHTLNAIFLLFDSLEISQEKTNKQIINPKIMRLAKVIDEDCSTFVH